MAEPEHAGADGTPGSRVPGSVSGGARWSRSEATVAAILDATISEIAEVGIAGLRVAAVAEAAGVGTSSIYHFFGGRDGLIAAAMADRFDRSIGTDDAGPLPADGAAAAEQAELAQLFALLDPVAGMGRDAYASSLLLAATGVVTSPGGSSRRQDRIVALGAAARNPVLLARLGASLRVRISLVERAFTAARSGGLLPPGLSPRALANYSLAHQMGLVPNELMHEPVPDDEWITVSVRVLSGVLRHDEDHADFARAGEVLDLLVPLRRDPSEGYGDDPEGRVCAAAIRSYRRGGPRAVTVEAVRRATGVSAGWFHRHFTDRDGLLDAIRIDLVRAHLRDDVRAMGAIARWATTPEEWTAAVLIAANASLSGGRDAVRWDTVEALAASLGRPALRRALGEIESTAVAGFADALEDAQDRGLVAPAVPRRAAARFLMGYHFGLLVGEVSGLVPTPAEWRTVIGPLLRALTPAGWERDPEADQRRIRSAPRT